MNRSTDDVTGVRRADGRTWFVRLYALAVVAHIAGNRPLELDVRGVVTLVLGLAAAVLFVEARRTALLATVAGLVVVTAWLQAPVLGNHWFLMATVSVALLVGLLRSDWWTFFAPTGRWILVVFYAFAGIAKLNQPFLTSSTSCSLVYANQNLGSWGLPLIAVDSSIAGAIPVATILIELSIPPLLVFAATRRYAVGLAYLFHFLISLDLDQHFYDFTAVLFALFALFLDDGVRDDLERSLGVVIDRLARPLLVVMAVFVIAAVVEPTELSVWLVLHGVFFFWIPAGLLLVVATIRRLSHPMHIRLRPTGVAALAIIAIVGVNGLTPYLGVKDVFAFQMYANFQNNEGAGFNHWFVADGPIIDSRRSELIRIVDTNDERLRRYVETGALVPIDNVRHLLAGAPEAYVEFRPGEIGAEIAGDEAALTPIDRMTGEEHGERLSILDDKIFRFRSIEPGGGCQTVWLPAL